MKNWPSRRILSILAGVLIAVGVGPLLTLLWFGRAHNFQPLSMPLPLQQGDYTSAEFKTDLDEPYMVQIELMDSTHRGIGLNPDAVIDLDWSIVDSSGGTIAQGASQKGPLSFANNVNLGEYHPRRGTRQKMIVAVHRKIEEPAGSHVTLEINSTEDPEGMAFGFVYFGGWAILFAGSGLILLVVMLATRRRGAVMMADGTRARTR